MLSVTRVPCTSAESDPGVHSPIGEFQEVVAIHGIPAQIAADGGVIAYGGVVIYVLCSQDIVGDDLSLTGYRICRLGRI